MCSLVFAWCIEWQEVQLTSFCRWNEFEALMCSEPEAWQVRQRSVMASGVAFLYSNTASLLGSSAWAPPGPRHASQPSFEAPPSVSFILFQCRDCSKQVVCSTAPA